MACVIPTTFAAALYKFVTENNWGFRSYDGSKESYANGVAYYVIPYRRLQTNTRDIWYRKAISPADPVIEPPLKGTPYVIIRWSYLLKAALDINDGLQPFAWMALRFFKEDIRKYDPVLAEDLTVYTEFAKVPLATIARMRSHLVDFFNRTEGHELIRKAFYSRILQHSSSASIKYELQRFAQVHYDPEATKQNKEYLRCYNLPNVVSVFNPTELKDRIPHLARSVKEYAIPAALRGWPSVAHYITSGTGAIDGVYSFKLLDDGGYVRMVNWPRLLEIAESKPLENTMLAQLSSFFGLDDRVERAIEARQAFNKIVGPAVFYRRKRYTLDQLAAQVGITDVPVGVFDTQWDAYYTSALMQYTHNWNVRAEGYRKFLAEQTRLTRPDITSKDWKYKIVTQLYQNTQIKIVRRRASDNRYNYYFTLPYELHEGYKASTQRHGLVLHIQGTEYWSLRGISKHTTTRQPFGKDIVPLHAIPEAEPFFNWATVKARELDGPLFNKQIFEQQLSHRQLEVREGKREHLGPFTTYEDVILAGFFENRAPGDLSKLEKLKLQDKMVGRTLSSLIYRVYILAFKYARRYGWVAYTKSGYFIRHSPKRRKQWLKEGVPL